MCVRGEFECLRDRDTVDVKVDVKDRVLCEYVANLGLEVDVKNRGTVWSGCVAHVSRFTCKNKIRTSSM